jgi:hypothetical protein
MTTHRHPRTFDAARGRIIIIMTALGSIPSPAHHQHRQNKNTTSVQREEMATHENKEVKDHMQAAGAQHGHGTIDPGVLWKIQFDKDKWEQRGREMAEREQRVESEGFHHQHHHVPLPVPHPTFLIFPSGTLSISPSSKSLYTRLVSC